MTNTKYFRKHYVKSVMSKVNPFYQRMASNPEDYMMFNQVADAYYYIIFTFIKNCPRGYIELPFILSKIYPEKKLIEIRNMTKDMNDLGVHSVNVITYMGKDGVQFFEAFFTALHSLCDTTMDHQAFKVALGYAKHLEDVLNVENRDI